MHVNFSEKQRQQEITVVNPWYVYLQSNPLLFKRTKIILKFTLPMQDTMTKPIPTPKNKPNFLFSFFYIYKAPLKVLLQTGSTDIQVLKAMLSQWLVMQLKRKLFLLSNSVF
jgi:hypothetical protein